MHTTRPSALQVFMLLIVSDSVMATAATDNAGNGGIIVMIIIVTLLALIIHWFTRRACPVCHKEGTFRATGNKKHEAEYRCSACTHTEWQEIKCKCD